VSESSRLYTIDSPLNDRLCRDAVPELIIWHWLCDGSTADRQYNLGGLHANQRIAGGGLMETETTGTRLTTEALPQVGVASVWTIDAAHSLV
jgi:hypothetical protein